MTRQALGKMRKEDSVDPEFRLSTFHPLFLSVPSVSPLERCWGLRGSGLCDDSSLFNRCFFSVLQTHGRLHFLTSLESRGAMWPVLANELYLDMCVIYYQSIALMVAYPLELFPNSGPLFLSNEHYIAALIVCFVEGMSWKRADTGIMYCEQHFVDFKPLRNGGGAPRDVTRT